MTKTKEKKPKSAKRAAAGKSRRAANSRRKSGAAEDLRSSADDQSAKTRSLQRGGLKARDLQQIRRNLVEQRQRILDAMRRNQAVEIGAADVGDEADQAGLNIERELQLELSDNERSTLDQIGGALRKMDKGTFGLCEQCRLAVETLRIKALPFARYCIKCQNSSEKATATLL